MAEWQIQARFIELFKSELPEQIAFHIPNSHASSIKNRFWMTKIGLLSGVPDIFMPQGVRFVASESHACAHYNGFFIEFKSKAGVLSENQQSVIKTLAEKGYPTLITCSHHLALAACILYLHAPARLSQVFPSCCPVPLS